MKKASVVKRSWLCPILITLATSAGCVAPSPKPEQLVAPQPIQGNSGQYMCPYTSDGVMAKWVDKAVNARLGGSAGSLAGTYIGQKACGQVPLVGGLLGGFVGKAVGRQVAIEASGGKEYIKSTSDLSFNRVDDLAVYLYVKHSSHPHFNDAFRAACDIYPDLRTRFHPAIQKAPRKRVTQTARAR